MGLASPVQDVMVGLVSASAARISTVSISHGGSLRGIQTEYLTCSLLDLYDKLCSFKGPSRRSFSWHSFSNSSNNTFGSPSSFWAASRTHGCDLRSLIGKASFHEFYHPSLTVNLSCGKCFSHFGTTEVSVSNIPEGIADCSSRSRWNTNISWKSIRTFLLKMP